MKRTNLYLVLILIATSIISFSMVSAEIENAVIIKFHSEGLGENVSINLSKYFPNASEFFYPKTDNITIIIRNNMATIYAKPGWKGDERVVITPNSSVIREANLTKEGELINLEPVIELKSPSENIFSATHEEIEFSINVFDPENDKLYINWFVEGMLAKEDFGVGRTISKFTLKEEDIKKMIEKKGISGEDVFYSVIVNINDTKNMESQEWKFNILNQSCIDKWKCSEWSECVYGKKIRKCEKINPLCPVDKNKPSTEWLYPLCREKATCEPNWVCENWSRCRVDYNLKLEDPENIPDVIKTIQQRLCYDAAYCVKGTGLQFRDCAESVKVNAKRVEWCHDNYIEIYNAETGYLISRIREVNFSEPRLDIELSLTDLGKLKYCSYCYDGKKNYDETGIDCGGSCMPCSGEEATSPIVSRIPLLIILNIAVLSLIILLASSTRRMKREKGRRR